ncbi:hypothetical protein QZH41_014440 [Actinostola sp. cb2023]|nr:hypothetical protein QZH41_014440 [Actinostola sp. cb2023]
MEGRIDWTDGWRDGLSGQMDGFLCCDWSTMSSNTQRAQADHKNIATSPIMDGWRDGLSGRMDGGSFGLKDEWREGRIDWTDGWRDGLSGRMDGGMD